MHKFHVLRYSHPDRRPVIVDVRMRCVIVHNLSLSVNIGDQNCKTTVSDFRVDRAFKLEFRVHLIMNSLSPALLSYLFEFFSSGSKNGEREKKSLVDSGKIVMYTYGNTAASL